jgi:uncharacterized membrane protein (UPF0136 family)
MEHTSTIDEGKAPGVVGIAALIGFGKAAFEGLMGIIGVAASHSLGDSFGGAMLAFGILFFLASWLLLKGSKAGYWASVILAALGLTAAVVYLFKSSDVIFMAFVLIGGLNALVLYLLLGTRSAREFFGRQ